MITSYNNSQIKNIIALRKKRKARDDQGVFLAEGMRMFRETPRERIEKVFVSQSLLAERGVEESLAGLSAEIVADEVFRKASDTVSPQGILCIVRQRRRTPQELFAGEPSAGGSFKERPLAEEPLEKGGGVFLVLEALQDPGNLGTIIRSAEGAGVRGILADERTVDLYSPKVVRSTMGSLYRVPFARVDDVGEAAALLKKNRIPLFAAHLKGDINYTEADYRAGAAFLIGNEGNGLEENTAALADRLVRIPMCGELESLNASVAASLLVYEAYRQRCGHRG